MVPQVNECRMEVRFSGGVFSFQDYTLHVVVEDDLGNPTEVLECVEVILKECPDVLRQVLCCITRIF